MPTERICSNAIKQAIVGGSCPGGGASRPDQSKYWNRAIEALSCLGAAAVLMTGFGSPADAAMPRQMWLGVERILLSCEMGNGIEADELCPKAADELRRRSSLPVVELPVDESRPLSDLQITFVAALGSSASGRPALLLSMETKRQAGVPVAAGTGLAANISTGLDEDGRPLRLEAALDELISRILPAGRTKKNGIVLKKAN